MAAAALSNYQLGDLLGRGASGNVYRALNFLNGETVAIKSISLLSLPPSTLPDIMSEIDLLKNLNHPNIVKYKGFARDKESLFIVLEYCENGSLQSILKKFGKFPESLVAVYVSQVLEGLVYLHEQGVIHRDIKGANILTNKDGSVKLADFGVSSRAPAPDLAAATADADNEVVGSPYWMAPEVIEQSGASTASDIWSVGCVVVELLEGKPPYGELAPMQALWRIVQDESMRVPDGASPIVKDFLYQCFQRDPNLRITAKKLLRHPWMQSARKNLDAGAAATGTLPKVKGSASSKSQNGHWRAESINAAVAPLEDDGSRNEAGTVRSRKPVMVYDEAIQRVQEWNEALNATPKALGTMRRIPALPRKSLEPRREQPLSGVATTGPAPPQQPAGLLLKNQHVSDVLSRAREGNEAERWDDDFAFDTSIPKIHPLKPDATPRSPQNQDHDPNHETLRPTKGGLDTHKKPTQRLKGVVEDYSDLAAGEDQLELKLSNMKLRDKGHLRLMHPNDLRKIRSLKASSSSSRPLAPPVPSLPKPEVKTRSPQTTTSPVSAIPAAVAASGSTSSPPGTIRTPPGSRQSSLRGRNAAASESNLELQKYTEAEDDDYSDMFDGPVKGLDGSNTMGSLQLTRRSNRSWQEDEDDEADPFAEIEDDFDADNLEANLLRDKRATLFASITKLVDQLEVATPMSQLQVVCDELLSLFESSSPGMGLEAHFVSIHGMLAVLEVLESRLSRDVTVRILKIVNLIVSFDVDILESFCLVGGIPVIIPYTSKKHSLDTRLEASAFIQHMTRSPLTLQMFISCRGIKILVELLDEDYIVNKTLVLAALEGIGSVFDLHSPTPKPDFCRMFTREGILDPLSTALLALIQDSDVDEETPKRAVDVLLLFGQVAQGDVHVREAFATRTIMMRLLKALDLLPRRLLVTAIKAVKHLSTSPELIEVLQNSNAMETLVKLLGKSVKGSYSNEICSHIFQTIFAMCRLSKARQEEAAACDIVPLLKRVIVTKSQLKQFALPVLCDLANAGKVSRRKLRENDGMTLYLDLLDDPYWRISALEAVLAWMQDEPVLVEGILVEKAATDSLSKCFVQAAGVSFEGILDPFLKILRLSPQLASKISCSPFLKRLAEALEKQSKAVVKLNLLRILKVVSESYPDREALVSRHGFGAIVHKLSEQDSAVLVRSLAKEIYPSLVFGHTDQTPLSAQQLLAASANGKRVVSVLRRNQSDGPSKPARTTMRAPPATVASMAPPHMPLSDHGSLGSESHGTTSSAHQAPALSESVGDGCHKRKISRNHLKDVQWQAGENGRLKSVRTPLRTGQAGSRDHTDRRDLPSEPRVPRTFAHARSESQPEMRSAAHARSYSHTGRIEMRDPYVDVHANRHSRQPRLDPASNMRSDRHTETLADSSQTYIRADVRTHSRSSSRTDSLPSSRLESRPNSRLGSRLQVQRAE